MAQWHSSPDDPSTRTCSQIPNVQAWAHDSIRQKMNMKKRNIHNKNPSSISIIASYKYPRKPNSQPQHQILKTRSPYRRSVTTSLRTPSLRSNRTTIPQINPMTSLNAQTRTNRSSLRHSRNSLNSLARPCTPNRNRIPPHQRPRTLRILRLTERIVRRARLRIGKGSRHSNKRISAVNRRPSNRRSRSGVLARRGRGCGLREHEAGPCAGPRCRC